MGEILHKYFTTRSGIELMGLMLVIGGMLLSTAITKNPLAGFFIGLIALVGMIEIEGTAEGA